MFSLPESVTKSHPITKYVLREYFHFSKDETVTLVDEETPFQGSTFYFMPRLCFLLHILTRSDSNVYLFCIAPVCYLNSVKHVLISSIHFNTLSKNNPIKFLFPYQLI